MNIKVSNQEEIKEILEYIGADYKAIPYMYVNVIKYGMGSENVHTFIDRSGDGAINGVYLVYYDCIHFYTRDTENYPLAVFMDFVSETPHRVIMLQKQFGDRLGDLEDSYYIENNHVIDMDKVGLDDMDFKSTVAGREDIAQIVELLIADPEYVSVYDKKVLSDQLYDRYDGNFSRFFVVKMDGKVVATCSTYGEVDGFAILGGVIVHPDYRRRGLAKDVENYACHLMASEGVSRVGFVNFNNTPSLALHEKLGACRIAALTKLVKKI